MDGNACNRHCSKGPLIGKCPVIPIYGASALSWLWLLLLLSGDIETNPGPEEQTDPTREREEEPFDDTACCVFLGEAKGRSTQTE